MSAPATAGAVVVDVPASVRSLRLLRLAAAGLASDAGLDLEGVESARVAIDELSSVVMASGYYDRLVVSFERRDDGLHVWGSAEGGTGRSEPLQPDRIVEELLAVCAAEWHLGEGERGPTFWFRLDGGPRSA